MEEEASMIMMRSPCFTREADIPGDHFQLFFLQCQHLDLRCIFIVLLPSCASAQHNGEEGPVRNSGFILYKLQESCTCLLVLIALSIYLILERSQWG